MSSFNSLTAVRRVATQKTKQDKENNMKPSFNSLTAVRRVATYGGEQ